MDAGWLSFVYHLSPRDFDRPMRGMSAMELIRKSIHIGAIALALLFRFSWFEYWMALVIAGIALLFNLFLMPRVGRRLFRPEEGSPPAGMLFYPSSIFLVVLLFWYFGDAPHVAAAAWSLMALGDGLSALLGKTLGRHPLPWNPKKTYLGLVGFFLGGTFGVAFFLWFVSPRTGAAVLWHQAYMVALIAAFVAGVVETFPWRINDNLSVPLIGGAVIYLLDSVEGWRVDKLVDNPWRVVSFALLVGVLLAVAYHKRLVELSTAIAGWFIGFLALLFMGFRGFLLVLVYFVVVDLLARFTAQWKQAGQAAVRKAASHRIWNAVATLGIVIFLAFWGAITPHSDFFQVAMVAALATAFADSVAAELGQMYGGRPYLLPSFRQVTAGTPGAVSVAGTIFGFLAALVFGVLAQILQLLPSPVFIGVVAVAGFIGITWESAFSPSLLRRGFSAHTLNFLCTLVGALAAMVLYWLFQTV
jgi:uncharacterized protein (TIGR00297 family)